MPSLVEGTGSYTPPQVVTNDDLAQRIDTSDEWIVQRTGIRSRHLLEADELPSTMAIEAAKRALDDAGRSPADVGLVLVATNFPDMICPGTAPFVCEALGIEKAPFFDITAGCTGFVYGLAVVDGLLRSGVFPSALLIGMEALSRVTDWSDRRTCVLFGDGAGAAYLQPFDGERGILGSAILGDAVDKTFLLHMPGGGSRQPASSDTVAGGGHFLKMEGSGVFRHAVPMMETATRQALEAARLRLSDVDWVVPHQANLRIVDALVRRLGVDPERVIVNLDRVANTSTASIPIAYDEARRDGRIRDGDLVVMTAFGAGVTYGAVVLRA